MIEPSTPAAASGASGGRSATQPASGISQPSRMLAPNAAATPPQAPAQVLAGLNARRETRAAERPARKVGAGVAGPDDGEEPEDRRPADGVFATQCEGGDDKQRDDAGARQPGGAPPQSAALHAGDDESGCSRRGSRRDRSDRGEERTDRNQACDAGHTRGIHRRPAEQPAQFEPGEHACRPHGGDEDGAALIGHTQRNGRKHSSRRCAQYEAAPAARSLLPRHARCCHINATIGR